jgi:fructose-1,6-bisphosphatase/inositol monophosphatase family enzyme
MDVDATQRLLRELAHAVADFVKQHPFEEWGVDLGKGADGTAMKLVDEIAEKEIVRVLKAHGGPWNVLSEGGGLIHLGGDGLLVTDPIDGTTNAIRGIPFYCVSLALGRERLSDVEAGIVLNVPTGDVFEAAKGRGATLNGRPLKVRAPGRSLVVSTTHGADVKAAGLRSFGASALEMCLVASGALDAYHYPKPILRVTDVAAATLIVREAGGIVIDDAGADLDLRLTLEPRFTLTAASSREMAKRVGVLPE